jgi:hypothetical protein
MIEHGRRSVSKESAWACHVPLSRLSACLIAGLAVCVPATAAERRDANSNTQPLIAPASAPARSLRVQADRPIVEAYDFWRVGNYDMPSLLLDGNVPNEIADNVPLIRELNLLYLLGGHYRDKDCWFQEALPDGNVRADFTGMIAELKAVLALGMTPRIDLEKVPYNMSDLPRQSVYGNTAPPKD